MVAPELYGAAQPPESASSPRGQVATTDPSPNPDKVIWLTTWWMEGEAGVSGVDVADLPGGVGVGRVAPPPTMVVPLPEAGVPVAARVAVCALPAVTVVLVCARLPGVAPRALLESSSTITPSSATIT